MFFPICIYAPLNLLYRKSNANAILLSFKKHISRNSRELPDEEGNEAMEYLEEIQTGNLENLTNFGDQPIDLVVDMDENTLKKNCTVAWNRKR